MAITYEQAQHLKRELEPEYQERHDAHRRLRDFWHGRYWDNVDSNQHGIASIFRDITSRQSDVGPDMKVVRNLLFEICVKYQTYLSTLPMIRTYVDEPFTTRRRAQATLKERVLYATWSEVDMSRTLNQIAWFGPLMGDCFHGIWPDFDRNTVKSLVRSPEHAYPVTGFDGDMDAVIFSWKVPEARATRAFPNYKPRPKQDRIRGRETEATVEILEWSDGKEFARWVDGQLVNGVQHDLGFNLFEQVPFIQVPGEPWNHGAVEQAVEMIEAGNVLTSLTLQAMIENVFPRLVLVNPMKFSEQIDTGPGAVIAVNEGGNAFFLAPPTATLSAATALGQENERAVKQDASMPDVNFGFGQGAPSIVTGKAINELQGAGTGSLVEMVQGTYTGKALSNWNEKALTIYQRMFTDDTIYLQGVKPGSMVDLNPRQFGVKFTGSQIVGSPRNEVVFSPYVGMHEKLIISLQALGAGLVSKKHSRDQIGIPDSDAMQEEIFAEAIDDAVLAALAQAMTEPTPEAANTAQQNAANYLEGLPAVPAPHPLLATGASVAPASAAPASGPGGQPVGSFPGADGQFKTPALALPPGSPVPEGAAPAPAPPGGGTTVSLNDAIAAFQAVQGIVGKVFLVGEIVQQGQTDGEIEVAVTDPADRDTLTRALPQYTLVFHAVNGEPSEQHVEVTPGSTSEPRGQQPDLSTLLGGAGA